MAGLGEFDGKHISIEQHEEKPDEVRINLLGQMRKIKGTKFYRCDLRTGKIEICPTREQHVLNMMMKGVDTIHRIEHSDNYIYNQSINHKNAWRKFMKYLYPNDYKEMLEKMPDLTEQRLRGERLTKLEFKYLGDKDIDAIDPLMLKEVDKIIYELSATEEPDPEMEEGLIKMIEML